MAKKKSKPAKRKTAATGAASSTTSATVDLTAAIETQLQQMAKELGTLDAQEQQIITDAVTRSATIGVERPFANAAAKADMDAELDVIVATVESLAEEKQEVAKASIENFLVTLGEDAFGAVAAKFM